MAEEIVNHKIGVIHMSAQSFTELLNKKILNVGTYVFNNIEGISKAVVATRPSDYPDDVVVVFDDKKSIFTFKNSMTSSKIKLRALPKRPSDSKIIVLY